MGKKTSSFDSGHFYLGSLGSTTNFFKAIIFGVGNVTINGTLIIWNVLPEDTNWRGRISTVDLLIKLACFITEGNIVFSTKSI
jgi:hypothetical protein